MDMREWVWRLGLLLFAVRAAAVLSLIAIGAAIVLAAQLWWVGSETPRYTNQEIDKCHPPQ